MNSRQKVRIGTSADCQARHFFITLSAMQVECRSLIYDARSHDRAEKRDRRVHLARGNIDDDESQRRQPIETTIPGQIAAPLLLDDGRLLAFVVNRQQPGTMKLWVSHDGGSSWPQSECLVVHEHQELARLSQGAENIDFAQYWEDMAKWSFGHPAIRRLDDRRVLVSYYAGTPGCLSIHSAIIAI